MATTTPSTLPAPPPGPGVAVRVRQAAHAGGEVLITLGVVLLLFVVYLLFWTNVRSDAAAASITDDLRNQWAAPPASSAPAEPGPSNPSHTIPAGAFAIMTIPRLGVSWYSPVLEPAGQEITMDELAEGVVHYKDTALPGQIGNFAVAGHRATHGEPFADLDRLRPGDQVVVETRDAFYTYVVDNDPRKTIVEPTAVWVLDPVPGKPEAKPTQALITLTTCNPRWASTHRMIVFGHLVQTQQK
jgi:sortase A